MKAAKYSEGELVSVRYTPNGTDGAYPWPIRLDRVLVLEVCLDTQDPSYLIDGMPEHHVAGGDMWCEEMYVFPYHPPSEKTFGELMTTTKDSSIRVAEPA